MSDLNRFCATGRLTRDPETRFLAGDKCVASLSIACSRTFVSGGEKKEETIFLDCEAWGKLAETIGQYCTKGKQIAIDGRLKMDQWEDKATGQKRSKVKVVIDSMTFIGKSDAPRADAPAPSLPPPRAAVQQQEDDQSEPPF